MDVRLIRLGGTYETAPNACGAGFPFSVALIAPAAQTIPSTEAKNHIGEKATVCGLVVSKALQLNPKARPHSSISTSRVRMSHSQL
jgi:hypothetical protein